MCCHGADGVRYTAQVLRMLMQTKQSGMDYTCQSSLYLSG